MAWLSPSVDRGRTESTPASCTCARPRRRRTGCARRHEAQLQWAPMAAPEHLYPFRSPMEREALRDALNSAGSLSWAVRDSIYYGVYLRAWHEHAGKLRIFGDRPHYVL